MGKVAGLGKKMAALGLMLLGSGAKAELSGWPVRMQASMEKIDAKAPGRIGVFVQDLSTGQTFSFRAEEPWYLASGVKVPIALALLREVEEGRISLGEKIRLEFSDFIDGAGETNSQPPGARVTLLYLLEQMLIHSDNTASDLLIRRVGLGRINRNVSRLVPEGFYKITTLADVRRLAYSGIFPGAMHLKNRDLLELKGVTAKKRMSRLAELLHQKIDSAIAGSLDEAYSVYYAKNLNSAKLSAYGELLRKIAVGEALDPQRTDLLLSIMQRVQTGKKRVKAGFSTELVWAHKTGTQYARVCDFGLAWPRRNPERKVVLAACARGFRSEAGSEKALRLVGEALERSGIFTFAEEK